jgi:hypothetical protein
MKKIKFISKNYSLISLISIVLFFSACGGGGSGGNSSSSSSGGGSHDTNKPKITLIGEKTVLLQLGQTYSDPGATAYDQEDGDLTALITKTSNVNYQKIGNYEIQYSVTDSAGNTDTAKRKIAIQNIIDNPSPRPGLTINEFSAANTHTKFDPDFKEFSDWIELYNNSNAPVSIGGYYLSDDPALLNKWRIPNGTSIPAHSYLLIWADKKDTRKTNLHTNFSLNADGETIILSNGAQAIVDKIEFPKQKSDISCMKNSDGLLYYMYPTPGAKNTQANSALFRSSEPVFTLQSGFYPGTQKLTITQEHGGKVYYTTDGSIPTRNSTLYTQPITISKTTVIRAKALETGRFLSSTENGTYFIGEDIKIPVISVAINPDYLFNDDYGMYTIGSGHTLDDGHENFRQDWERSASVEYFDQEKVSQFSQNIGLSIFGSYTRRYAKKSFAVKAKDKYGKKSIKYKLFQQKDLDKFTSFGIRSGGNGWHTSIFKDAMLQDLVHENMDVDYQANQPVVLFVNGEYWGVSFLRERFTKDYFKDNNGVKEKIDFLELNAQVKKGDATDYNNLITYIDTHDLADNNAYNEVVKKIDINNYLNYMVTEIYTGNLDWPNNNVRYWKEKTDNGKWRWLVYDLDFAFGVAGFDNLSYAAGDLIDNNYKNNQAPWSTFLFKNMLRNQTFRYRFIGKYLTHIYTTFQPARVESFIDSYKNKIAAEMPRDIQRWLNEDQYGSKRELNSYQRWLNEVNSLSTFASSRPAVAKQHLENYFGITTYHTLSIDVPVNGQIIIDDAHISQNFSENYLHGAIVELRAVPNNGYKFRRWSDGNTNPVRQVQINTNTTLQAEFFPL